eukprot:TRINITY_DN2959_c0_g2_i1.p1 TRINITY_DN2959_c0_g2~~TRINITY_DN2959_c0_g2_i1.p1  ORF type:complete len:120 (-),score=32.24 TRINITY_DN2959_c0_g2_i1:45-404(-)
MAAPNYTLSIFGDDSVSVKERISLKITKSGTSFLVEESKQEHSTFTGNKAIPDSGRRLTFQSLKAVANYPKALAIINWQAEITDDQGNFVRRLQGKGEDTDRLVALVLAWEGLVGCEWK